MQEDYASIAAKWWADKLRKVEPTGFDMRDDSKYNNQVMMLATLLANNCKNSEEKICNFQSYLADRIRNSMQSFYMVDIFTDYQPQGLLYQAAKECEIDPACFPFKTSMTVKYSLNGYSVTVNGESIL